MAEQVVKVEQGVPATTSDAWYIRVSDGSDVAGVSGLNQLLVTTGVEAATTTLSAQSATGAGTVAAFGSAKQMLTLSVTASAGVSAGVVALEVSQDNVNWYRTNGSALTGPGVTSTTVSGAWRYARGNVTTAITGGTVSATVMAA